MLATRMIAPILALLGALAAAGADAPPPSRHRQPVALAGSPDGSRVFAANRRAGTVSVIDPESGRVVAEAEVGGEPVDLASLPDGGLLAVDRAGGRLLRLAREGDGLATRAELAVGDDPAAVAVDPAGPRAAVASTGPRTLTIVALGAGLERARTIPLPFAPRLMAWAGPKLLAADAYGGRLAVVDPGSGAVESVRSIPAHNIRGLAVSPDGKTLAVAHQVLSRLARSSFEDVHWGVLMNNHLRLLRLDAVLAAGDDAGLLRGSRLIDLGENGRGTGDPGAVAFDRSGGLAVALSGVAEVAYGPATSVHFRRAGVGRGPSAVLPDPDGRRVFVADAFDDAVSVVDVRAGKRSSTIPLGPHPEPGPVDRGERLFRDARLSHDGWMSCQSCHTDGHTNGLVADTLGDGAYGAPKRVTSLRGVGSTGPWTWLGAADSLEGQVRKSIETSMRGRSPTDGQVEDLAAYLRSIPPPRPAPSDDPAVARGRATFRARKCAGCHAGPEFTEAGTFDVGLVDEAGNREFNPPSLRGVADRAPYLHDGRAPTLPEVFLRHRHPHDAGWAPAEVDDLAAYLRTL